MIYSGFPESNFMGEKRSLDISASSFSFPVLYFSYITLHNFLKRVFLDPLIYTLLHYITFTHWKVRFPAVRIPLLQYMRCEFLHGYGYVSAPACSLVRTHLHLKKNTAKSFCQLIPQTFLIQNIMGQRFKCIFVFHKLDPFSSLISGEISVLIYPCFSFHCFTFFYHPLLKFNHR